MPVTDPSRETGNSDAGLLLQRFLDASEDAERKRHRDSLIADHAAPLLRKILGSRMRTAIGGTGGAQGEQEEAADELYCEALIALGLQLDRWQRDLAAPPPPDRFLDYVAVIAYNAWKQWIRRSRPQSTHAQSQMHYLLTRQPSFALWKNAQGESLGGFREWSEQSKKQASPEREQEMLGNAEEFVCRGLKQRNLPPIPERCSPPELLAALLEAAGGPVTLTTLVTAFEGLARFWSAGSPPVQAASGAGSSQDGEEGEDVEAQFGRGGQILSSEVELQQERRDFLRRLWAQVKLLSPEQRVALILNLQDGDVRQFPVMQIAGFGEIAATLGKTPAELARVWNSLPLDDETIAADLEITPAQVKNLRQAAYRTLAWRLRPFDRGLLRRLWEEAILMEAPRPAVLMLYLRDAQGFSILALLPRESIVNREVVAEQLAIALLELNQHWPNLPLSYQAIGELLHRPQQQVVLLYQETYTRMAPRLKAIWSEG